MKLTELSEFVKEYKSLRAASTELGLPVQNVHWALNKVKGRTYVLLQEDGTYMLLREVVSKKGS
nr:MAG: hypothetical protein [Bacteriophage sp.]